MSSMAVAASHKTGGRAQIRIGKVDARRICGVTAIEAIAASPRLSASESSSMSKRRICIGASGFQLLADQARQIDIEALRMAVSAGVVERRIVILGEEANEGDARKVRPFRTAPRVPETRHVDRRLDGRSLCRNRRGAEQRAGDDEPGQSPW